MITIEQRIKKIAEGLGVNYYFGDWQRINVAGDTGRIDFPLIAYLLPPSGTVNLSGPGVRETENGVLAFLGLTVFDFEANENKRELAPRLYSLSDLQRAANAKFKMGAKDTLATVQSLYEAKLLSYPRTDATVITKNEFVYLKDNLSGYLGILGHTIDKPNLTPRKKYVDDAKVQEH